MSQHQDENQLVQAGPETSGAQQMSVVQPGNARPGHTVHATRTVRTYEVHQAPQVAPAGVHITIGPAFDYGSSQVVHHSSKHLGQQSHTTQRRPSSSKLKHRRGRSPEPKTLKGSVPQPQSPQPLAQMPASKALSPSPEPVKRRSTKKIQAAEPESESEIESEPTNAPSKLPSAKRRSTRKQQKAPVGKNDPSSSSHEVTSEESEDEVEPVLNSSKKKSSSKKPIKSSKKPIKTSSPRSKHKNAPLVTESEGSRESEDDHMSSDESDDAKERAAKPVKASSSKQKPKPKSGKKDKTKTKSKPEPMPESGSGSDSGPESDSDDSSSDSSWPPRSMRPSSSPHSSEWNSDDEFIGPSKSRYGAVVQTSRTDTPQQAAYNIKLNKKFYEKQLNPCGENSIWRRVDSGYRCQTGQDLILTEDMHKFLAGKVDEPRVLMWHSYARDGTETVYGDGKSQQAAYDIKVNRKLREANLGPCPEDYDWQRVEEGYRCTGGTHLILTDDMKKFMEGTVKKPKIVGYYSYARDGVKDVYDSDHDWRKTLSDETSKPLQRAYDTKVNKKLHKAKINPCNTDFGWKRCARGYRCKGAHHLIRNREIDDFMKGEVDKPRIISYRSYVEDGSSVEFDEDRISKLCDEMDVIKMASKMDSRGFVGNLDMQGMLDSCFKH